jgi:hypothetical protein
MTLWTIQTREDSWKPCYEWKTGTTISSSENNEYAIDIANGKEERNTAVVKPALRAKKSIDGSEQAK